MVNLRRVKPEPEITLTVAHPSIGEVMGCWIATGEETFQVVGFYCNNWILRREDRFDRIINFIRNLLPW